MNATGHSLRRTSSATGSASWRLRGSSSRSAGSSVTLNDIAHHAGVGVGTVYRRFPDKEVLIDTLFRELLDDWAHLFEEGLTDADPWHAVVSVHERAREPWARNRGLKEILLGSPQASERATQQRAQLHPLAAKLIERAQADGEIRADATGSVRRARRSSRSPSRRCRRPGWTTCSSAPGNDSRSSVLHEW